MSATERLDQWAALAGGATPAEMWEHEDSYGHPGGSTVRIKVRSHEYAAAYAGTEANAAFIAAAREAVPALIAAVRAVLTLVDGVQPTRLIGGSEWPLLDARDVRDAIAFALEKGEDEPHPYDMPSPAADALDRIADVAQSPDWPNYARMAEIRTILRETGRL